MKTCKKCQGQFPVRVVIDGKLRSLQNRRFCLSCSPFGSHNTSDLVARENESFNCCKVCPKCNQEKSISEFYKKGNGRQSWCKSCTMLAQKRRWNKLKVRGIEYLGGKCVDCGNSKYHPVVYDFHHMDGEQKDDIWTTLRLKAWPSIVKELNKCVLLCGPCHRMRHIHLELW